MDNVYLEQDVDEQEDQHLHEDYRRDLSQSQIEEIESEMRAQDYNQSQGDLGNASQLVKFTGTTVKVIDNVSKYKKAIIEGAKQIVRNASPALKTIQISQETVQLSSIQVFKQSAYSCISKVTTGIYLGVAAIEAARIIWKYYNAEKNTEEQKNLATRIRNGELKAMGLRTISSFAISSTSIVIGATLGSIFPVVGTTVGGVVGAIIGIFVGYAADQQINKMFHLENNLDEAYKTFALRQNMQFTLEYLKNQFKLLRIVYNPDRIGITDEQRSQNRERLFQVCLYYELIKKDKRWE